MGAVGVGQAGQAVGKLGKLAAQLDQMAEPVGAGGLPNQGGVVAQPRRNRRPQAAGLIRRRDLRVGVKGGKGDSHELRGFATPLVLLPLLPRNSATSKKVDFHLGAPIHQQIARPELVVAQLRQGGPVASLLFKGGEEAEVGEVGEGFRATDRVYDV